MKKCIFIIVVMVSIGLSALADTVKITHDKNINVRRKPTTESIIIGTAAAGEEYEYIGTEKNGWIHFSMV